MASFDPSPSPTGSNKRRRKGVLRRMERCCSKTCTSLPLVFVYGITTWAVYVEITLSLAWARESHLGYFLLLLGVLSYGLLNWSYSVAAFTDPGSPINAPPPSRSSARQGYSYLPTQEPRQPDVQSLTVKSSGDARFCKKCQTKKPDRAHHCSSCGRCVLKMDHHCPWLATCVGFRNYKPFILFCSYVTLFCWICFGVSSTFLWTQLLDADMSENAIFGINTVLLVVLSGIFGIVLTGFTGWHISLAWRNQTTIECLEKTRYTSPIQKGISRAQHAFDPNAGEEANLVQKYGQQLTKLHANAIPGVTRPEEGEERPSPVPRQPRDSDQLTAVEALRMTYNDMEREREVERYEQYLDEKDSEKMPNAFDLGWRRNLELLFGDRKLLWLLPICNTIGDGWNWEPSAKWLAERERISAMRQAHSRGSTHGSPRNVQHPYASTIDDGEDERHYLSTSNGIASVPMGRRSPGKANQVLGRSGEQYSDDFFGNDSTNADMPLKTLRRTQRDDDASSVDGLYNYGDDVHQASDEDDVEAGGARRSSQDEWRDWD